MRERVAPCCQCGFWEILPAFRAGELYSLLGVGDRCRAWEKGKTCSFIWDDKAPACCVEDGRVLWMFSGLYGTIWNAIHVNDMMNR